MISYYQTRLLPFLSLKSWDLPSNTYSNYYLSWEDGLWDILPSLGIQPGSTILLPYFYCLDVIANMANHGYQVKLYPLDSNFQISKSSFLEIYKKINPELIIFFHPCGITNNLSVDQGLIRLLSKNSYILDDYVHKIVNPQELTFLSDKHFAMDSLRKNTPLSGSFIYCTKSIFAKLSKPKIQNLSYTLGVILFYWYYRLILLLGVGLKNSSLVKYAHQRSLKTHDDLVGDSLSGNAGMPWVPLLHRHLDFAKIRKVKSTEAKYYQNHLTPLVNHHPEFSIPLLKDRDLGELHAFPIVVQKPLALEIKAKLDKLNVWPKFSDCSWSGNKLVFFLPLGFHITKADQDQIINVITQTTK